MSDNEDDKQNTEKRRGHGPLRVIIGCVLVLLGLMFFLQSVYHIGIIKFFWPIILIAVGLGVIVSRKR